MFWTTQQNPTRARRAMPRYMVSATIYDDLPYYYYYYYYHYYYYYYYYHYGWSSAGQATSQEWAGSRSRLLSGELATQLYAQRPVTLLLGDGAVGMLKALLYQQLVGLLGRLAGEISSTRKKHWVARLLV